MDIRRLSTKSSVLAKPGEKDLTEWKWYWKEKDDDWREYKLDVSCFIIQLSVRLLNLPIMFLPEKSEIAITILLKQARYEHIHIRFGVVSSLRSPGASEKTDIAFTNL